MPFRLIKGTFHVKGYSPDGDSIRFMADNPANWSLLSGPAVDLNARDHAQLRIEAIDTLETHYSPSLTGRRFHQPKEFAGKATATLLDRLGITNIKFSPTGASISSAKDGTRGYILSRAVEHNGRPVCFVFAGDSPKADGASVVLRSKELEASINYQLVTAGLAYPTYYTGLFYDLRRKITQAAVAARKAGKGFWPKDKTNSGVDASSVAALEEREIMLPKLFRRLIAFMGNGGSVAGFKQYLSSHPDPVTYLPTGHFTNLDTFIVVQGNTVRLTVKPEQLVFRT